MSTSSGSLRVGFLGLGTMGAPMAMRLLSSGVPLIVWNRTVAKTHPLAKAGAKVGKGPAHVAAEVDLIITMVSQPQDVEDVVLGPDGVVDGIRSGAVLLDMSTVSPATSRKLAAAVTTKRAEFLDAPVVGSKGPASDGSLVILVGGLPSTLERCRPILTMLGRRIIHAGGVGSGSALKLATNLMLAHLVAGLAEGLLLVQRLGLDPQCYLEVLEESPFRSPWYGTKGTKMIGRDFSTSFALKHMRKDLRLMGELANEAHAAIPVTLAIEQVFQQSEAAGKGTLDYSAILSYLDDRSAA